MKVSVKVAEHTGTDGVTLRGLVFAIDYPEEGVIRRRVLLEEEDCDPEMLIACLGLIAKWVKEEFNVD